MDKSATASNRESFWANLKGYHQKNHMDASVVGRRNWFANLVTKTATSKNYKDILELGCNDGTNLWRIKQQNSNLNLHGIDISRSAIKYAQETLQLKHVKIGSIYELKSSYENKKFDVIYTMGVLIHIPHDMMVSVCVDMLKLLKDDGQIYCAESYDDTNQATYIHEGQAHRWVYNYKQLFTEAADSLSQPIVVNVNEIDASMQAGNVKHLISVNKVPL
jgi:2-polyprenyl-3-methyl-5-hydroxy-6-metoxy-1,4-benzoquinol methylase